MEQGSGESSRELELVDLSSNAGSSAVAWTVGVVAAIATVVVTALIVTQLFGFGGAMGVLPGLCSLYLVSWWRLTRLAANLGELERQTDSGVLRLRVRSGTSMWFVGSGVDVELVVSDGWVLLGERGWPAASVTLGREPNWWAARTIELLTPSGAVRVSAVPKGDLAAYHAAILDRKARPLLERALVAQRVAGPSPAGWYPDPQQPEAWRWWDGTAWSAPR